MVKIRNEHFSLFIPKMLPFQNIHFLCAVFQVALLVFRNICGSIHAFFEDIWMKMGRKFMNKKIISGQRTTLLIYAAED